LVVFVVRFEASGCDDKLSAYAGSEFLQRVTQQCWKSQGT
jgi:hypothetical protein